MLSAADDDDQANLLRMCSKAEGGRRGIFGLPDRIVDMIPVTEIRV
jgi:hypothetical protein